MSPSIKFWIYSLPVKNEKDIISQLHLILVRKSKKEKNAKCYQQGAKRLSGKYLRAERKISTED
jgi:hypothetical protein